MAEIPSLSVLRLLFADICNGWSVTSYNNSSVYIRHLSHREHLALDVLQDRFRDEAEAKGLPTREKKLLYLKKMNLWSDEKDRELAQQEEYLHRLNKNVEQAMYPAQADDFRKLMNEADSELQKMRMQKDELLGLTAEKYSINRINDYYIIKNLYSDISLKHALFSEESFDELEESEVEKIVDSYNKVSDIFCERNIRQLCIQSFFQSYYFLATDLYQFFGKPICDLTYYQVSLGSNAKYFKHIFENNDISLLPEEARNDADKLEDYVKATKKGKEVLDRAKGSDGSISSIVGATSKDYSAIGAKTSIFDAPKRGIAAIEMMSGKLNTG